jgi:hypothetical protein
MPPDAERLDRLEHVVDAGDLEQTFRFGGPRAALERRVLKADKQ